MSAIGTLCGEGEKKTWRKIERYFFMAVRCGWHFIEGAIEIRHTFTHEEGRLSGWCVEDWPIDIIVGAFKIDTVMDLLRLSSALTN